MCVIASLYLENQSILVKNRDRKYKASIKVIHELRDGVEVLYIHDLTLYHMMELKLEKHYQ
jgi:hypothetical protein